MRKMISAEVGEPCQPIEGNFLCDIGFDKFDDKLLLSGRQATAMRRRRQGIALLERMVSTIGETGRRCRRGGLTKIIVREEMGDTFRVPPIALEVHISCRTD
jgi:hypothetical protein